MYRMIRLAVICAVLIVGVSRAQDKLGTMEGVGGEQQRAERNIVSASQPLTKEAVIPVFTAPLPLQNAPASDTTNEPSWQVTSVKVRGTSVFADQIGLTRTLEDSLGGKTCSRGQVAVLLQEMNKQLIARGYYLARVWLARSCFENGVLTVSFDPGRIGSIDVRFGGKTNTVDGVWFSRSQIQRQMSEVAPGSVFDYTALYNSLYAVNTQPDLTLDTVIKVRKEIEDEQLVRYVDLGFDVTERIPLHAILDINNYGTEALGGWLASLTLQDLNLTRNNDVLTLNPAMSLNGGLESIAGSYSLPNDYGRGGNTTIYGGYSQLDVPDVAPGLGLLGTGWFAGLSESYNFINSRDTLLSASVGIVYRHLEDQYVIGSYTLEPRPADVMPLSLSLNYTEKTGDAWGGRNLATLAGFYNLMGDEAEISTLRYGAAADYMIARAQYARIQPIFGTVDAQQREIHQWILFFKLSGQMASGPLIPSEQLAIGGATTVRGYSAKSQLGDEGVYGTLELRTPVLLDLIRSSVLTMDGGQAGSAPFDRLQFVTFFDGGMTQVIDPLPGESTGVTMLSWGLGMRLAATQYAQFKIDWGTPLMKVEGDETTSAFHIDLQLQF